MKKIIVWLKRVVWKYVVVLIQTIDDVYENSEDCNSKKKRKVLVMFGYMIEDMEADKNWIVLNRKKT